MPAGLGTRFPACRYVVFNGLARYHGKTLIKGDHWGEWEVLLTSGFIRRRRAMAINYLHVLQVDAETIVRIAQEFPTAYRYIRRWIGWRALSEYLFDKMRRRRRGMALLSKKWLKRNPMIFVKMRLFVLYIYFMVKGVHHRKSLNSELPHRGRLSVTTHRMNDRPVVRVGSGGTVEEDMERLRVVNREMQALMQEQISLSASIAARMAATAGPPTGPPTGQLSAALSRGGPSAGPGALPALPTPVGGSNLAAPGVKIAPLAPVVTHQAPAAPL